MTTLIRIDEAQWTANAEQGTTPRDGSAAIAFVRDGNRMRFILPGRSDIVDAAIVTDPMDASEKLELFEDRSSAHKALAQHLKLLSSGGAA